MYIICRNLFDIIFYFNDHYDQKKRYKRSDNCKKLIQGCMLVYSLLVYIEKILVKIQQQSITTIVEWTNHFKAVSCKEVLLHNGDEIQLPKP